MAVERRRFRLTRALLGSRRITTTLGLALMAAVTLTLAALGWYERREAIANVTERNELLARVFADRATLNVEGSALAVSTLADLLRRGLAPEGPEMRTALEQTLVSLPFLRGIGIVDAQGLVVGSADGTEPNHRVQLAALGTLPEPGHDLLGPFVPARRLLDLAVDRPRAPTPPGVGFLPLVRGISLPHGQRLYVVAQLNAEAFANFQQVTMNDPRAAAALVSYDGRLLAATAGVTRAVGEDLSALPPFRDFLPRLEQGGWTGPGLRPGTQVGAFRVSATRPLLVMVELGQDDVAAEWLQRSRSLFFAGLAVLLFIGMMTLVATRSVHARESARAQLDVTIASLQELIFRADANGRITFANRRWQALTGHNPAGATGRMLWELVPPAETEAVRALFAPATEHEAARRLQATLADADGVPRSLDVAVMPLHEQGRLVGFAGSAIDVSERVQAQARLQAQLAFIERLLDVSPLPSSVVTVGPHDRRYALVNQAWEAFTGRRRADVVGQVVGSHLAPRERLQHEERDQQLLSTGQPVRYEASLPHHDGGLREVVINKLLLPGSPGEPARIFTVLVDVTEFRQAERATREARDAAEEASRAKSEFIANISHELRTPLQSIIGFSELGQMRGREQPRLAGMFDEIHGAGQRMLALVNDLLDVAKIESTVGAIHLERTDLRVLVHGVVRELAPLLAPRRLHIEQALPAHALLAKVDPQRMGQVLRNVLANAIKFSPEGGRIEVAGEITPEGHVQLRVADQGPGIPASELESVFEAFVQSSQTKDGSGGTGLGLAICRKIVAAHGGRIHAENRHEGGAVFVIELGALGPGETAPMPL